MFTFFHKMMSNDSVKNKELLEPFRPMRHPVTMDDVLQKVIIIDRKTGKINDKIDAIERRVGKQEDDINTLKIKNRCIIS